MKKIMILFAFLVLISCEDKKELEFFKTYDESELLQKQQEHQIPRMKFKLFQSKVLNMNTIFKPFNDGSFSDTFAKSRHFEFVF